MGQVDLYEQHMQFTVMASTEMKVSQQDPKMSEILMSQTTELKVGQMESKHENMQMS